MFRLVGDRKRRSQKPRVLFSCVKCRERKLKCDRKTPCKNCVKRNEERSCDYATDRPDDARRVPPGLHDRLRYLEDRLHVLENGSSDDDPSDATHLAFHTTDRAASRESTNSDAGLSLPKQTGTRFVNAAHWRAIMKHVTDEVRDIDNQTPEDGIHHSDKGDLSPRGPVLLMGLSKKVEVVDLVAKLPTRHVSDRAVLHYLNSKEPTLIMMHVPTFKHEYEEFWKTPSQVSTAWLALLYGIISCGTWIEYMTNETSTLGPEISETLDFYRKQCAFSLVSSNYTAPGKYKVEAAIMYLGTEYLQSNIFKTDVSVLLGTVTRLAIMSGYHRDQGPHSQLSIFEAEMRRRSWLLLLSIDRTISWQTGLPQVIHKGQGDTAPPRNLLDEDFGPNTTILPPSRPDDQTQTYITHMLATEKMMSLAGEIVEIVSLNSLTDERAISLNQELEVVRNEIPVCFRMPPSSESQIEADGSIILRRYALEITYQRARCILHRQYLMSHDTSEMHQQFRHTCVDAARRILIYQSDLFHQLVRKAPYRHRAWFGVPLSICDSLTAAMVLCLEIVHQAKAGLCLDSSMVLERRELLRTAYTTWKTLPRQSLDTSKAADTMASILDIIDRSISNASQHNNSLNLSLLGNGIEHSTRERNITGLSAVRSAHGILSSEYVFDLFDWGLWDREMHELNSGIV